jgi:hypothetical protein
MMRHVLALLVCAAAGFAPMLTSDAHAQDAGAELDAGIDAPAADAGVGEPTVDKAPTNAELLKHLAELKASYDALRAAQKAGAPTRLAVAGLLLSATFVLLGVVLRIRKQWTEWGKTWLPWVALGLGVTAGFLDHYVAGGSAYESLIVGAGPPLAVLVRELTKIFTKRG